MEKQNNKLSEPKIFISYCHADKEYVDKIDNRFISLGVHLIRDIRDAEDYASIKDFMRRIKHTDFVILVVSRSYMKSKYCMFEIMELLKNDDYKSKIFPIIIQDKDFDVYRDKAIAKYLSYWETQYNELYDECKSFRPEENVEIYEKLRVIKQIKETVGMFISTLQDLKSPSLETLEQTDFKPIIQIIRPGTYVFDQKLFKRCLKFLDPNTKVLAINYLNTNASAELGDLLLTKLIEDHWRTYDEFTKETLDLTAEVLREMKQETNTTKKALHAILRYFDNFVVDFFDNIDSYETIKDVQFGYKFISRAEYNRHFDKTREELIQNIINALVTCGYLKQRLFNWRLLALCLQNLQSQTERREIINKYTDLDAVEVGDWFLETIHLYQPPIPNGSKVQCYEYIKDKKVYRRLEYGEPYNESDSDRMILFARIITEMNKITPCVTALRDHAIEQLQNGYFGWDYDIGNWINKRKYALVGLLEAVGDDVSLSIITKLTS